MASYIRPEILAIPAAKMKTVPGRQGACAYRLVLERVLRYKPHTLGSEEKLLAMQAEMAGTANQVFRQLNNADLKFGPIKNERGETIELSHASFSALLHSPKRRVRKAAFQQYYQQFAAHENTLAATLSGSVQRDVYYAQAAVIRVPWRPRCFPTRYRYGLRQLDCRGAPQLAGPAPLLRAAATQDEAQGHPSLRHLRADPQRAGIAAHLEAGRRRGDRSARTLGQRLLRRADEGLSAGGAIGTRTRGNRAARSAPARSTASRTS